MVFNSAIISIKVGRSFRVSEHNLRCFLNLLTTSTCSTHYSGTTRLVVPTPLYDSGGTHYTSLGTLPLASKDQILFIRFSNSSGTKLDILNLFPDSKYDSNSLFSTVEYGVDPKVSISQRQTP